MIARERSAARHPAYPPAMARLPELSEEPYAAAVFPAHAVFASKGVNGASNASAAFVQDVSVDHRRPHISVAEKLLNRAEVVAILALILSRTGNGDMAPLYVVGQVALWIVMAAALVSAVDYFRRFNEVLSPRIADITVAREQRSDRKAG